MYTLQNGYWKKDNRFSHWELTGYECFSEGLDIQNGNIAVGAPHYKDGRGSAYVYYNTIVGVEDEEITPNDFILYQNYPNPFNPTTIIKYNVGNGQLVRPLADARSLQHVTLKIYDMLGREVATLVNETQPFGSYEVEFNGRNLSSGTYIYRLTAGNFSEAKKMVLIK